MNINENPGATPAEGQPPATVATPDTDTDGDGGKPFEAITSQEALDKIIGKRLTREKATHTQALAAVQAQLDDATAKLASAGTAPAGDPDASVTQQIADLQARLDAEVAARACAEASALRATRAAAKGLPAPLAAKLVGTTAEDIDAEIDELLPFLGAGAAPRGPKPNPQQGVPSLGSGGTLSAGRERYAAQHQ